MSLWGISLTALAALIIGAFMFSHVTASSSAMPVGDLPGWKQTAVQDFSVPAVRGQVDDVYGSEMRGYSGFADSSGRGTYTPDSVLSVEDGKLDYYLHTGGGVPRVASVIPFGYSGQKYGRYSIRFRYDSMPGYKIAFLLWPSSDNWNDGEIDWPEGGLDGPLYGGSAIKGSLAGSSMKFDPPERRYSRAGPGDWHVATTEWTPGKVRWLYDGELIGQTTVPSGVPDTPMRWTLQAETADSANKTFPDAATAGHLQIDWVVQYAFEP
jgi:hypothetical protein